MLLKHFISLVEFLESLDSFWYASHNLGGTDICFRSYSSLDSSPLSSSQVSGKCFLLRNHNSSNDSRA